MTVVPAVSSTDTFVLRHGVPRALVVGWLAAFAGFEWLSAKAGSPIRLTTLAASVSAIECLEIAVLVRLLAACDLAARLVGGEALATLAAAAGVVLMVGRAATVNAPMLGAGLIALYLLCRFGRSPAERRFAIGLCLFLSQYLFAVGPLIWLHAAVGRADAAAARALLAAAGYEVSGAGNLIIRSAQHFGAVVNYGCSTSYVLGLAVPGFLIMVLGLRGAFRRADVGYLLALAVCAAAVNQLRLCVVALGPAEYQFWHEGLGLRWWRRRTPC